MNTEKQKIVLKNKPSSLKEEFEDMKLKLESITEMFYILRKRYGKKKKDKSEKDVVDDVFNKDGIPLNSSFIGYTSSSNYPFILIINEKGNYKVGNKSFNSLSASAEFVSGVRRSGWTFWKLFDGRTLKEVYKIR